MVQNGQITIIEYGDGSIKYPIIIDGQINEDVLDLINLVQIILTKIS